MAEVVELKDFVAEAADFVASRIVAKQADRLAAFRLSLCGGSTPKAVYRALAERGDIDWERVLLTFGDERCVPPDHADSNYRMAKEALLDPAGVPRASVMRMAGEMDPAEAAQRYEGQFRKLAQLAGEAIFVHDLVLLGMGEDGHTASLFPGTAALEASDRWAVENYVAKLDSWRLTLTFPLINAAREVAFLVTGDAKRPIVDEILAGGSPHPAERVKAAKVSWLLG
ncbi:MAG: 6-phosphogluconolactonase [Verrucomicrobiae bacterium]|nr:6-phosphogluconolactonase [Verrucomicrobiae bacterium]MCB1087421.1 6-phosphogluconolactonase [Verrucomicrobiae bacterium]